MTTAAASPANSSANNAQVTEESVRSAPGPTIPTRPTGLDLAGHAAATTFATTVSMWVASWIAFKPAVGLSTAITLPVLGLILLVGAAWGAAASGRRSAIHVGLLTGAGSALLNILLLGAALGSADESGAAVAAERFRDDAPQIVVGFAVFSLVLGLAGGVLGRFAATADEPDAIAGRRAWLARLGVVTAVAFAPLIIVGGTVTSTESGMAVTDPVVAFTMPLEVMADPRIYIEHTHRLFGSLVGLAALTTLGFVIAADQRKTARIIAGAVFGLVTIQGILGALRVGENSQVLAALHGIFGQLVFAVGIVLAAVLSGLFADPEDGTPETTARAAARNQGLAIAALAILTLQLATGAMSRHMASAHAIMMHLTTAVIVFVIVALLAVRLMAAENYSRQGKTLRRVAHAIGVLVFCQFTLGFLAWWAVGNNAAAEIPLESELAAAAPIRTAEAFVTTAHQTIGATLLALATLAVVWTARIAPRRAAPLPSNA